MNGREDLGLERGVMLAEGKSTWQAHTQVCCCMKFPVKMFQRSIALSFHLISSPNFSLSDSVLSFIMCSSSLIMTAAFTLHTEDSSEKTQRKEGKQRHPCAHFIFTSVKHLTDSKVIHPSAETTALGPIWTSMAFPQTGAQPCFDLRLTHLSAF